VRDGFGLAVGGDAEGFDVSGEEGGRFGLDCAEEEERFGVLVEGDDVVDDGVHPCGDASREECETEREGSVVLGGQLEYDSQHILVESTGH
jgi:hypothetical protein